MQLRRLLAGAEVGKGAPAEVREQLGQDGPIALAVDKARADDGRRKPALLWKSRTRASASVFDRV